MKTLPEWMYYDGIVYYYCEWQGTEDLADMFFCGLFDSKDEDGFPAEVMGKDGYKYFLCSAEFSMEKAREDLLQRINDMR